ncbi:MAG: zf-HC2 domain-containing protein [Gemmatimonadota bacterium]|nr:zf-HC2 domain-containing protein [Gemmatimonadota bacterium]
MTELTHEQIRDVLPDYLHGNVDTAQRARIESHLHGCAECASEMRLIRMVTDAPSFAPMIDAVKVSSVILPYGGVPAAKPRPRTRVWQMLAAVAVVLVGAVTLISRGGITSPRPPEQVACRECTIAPVDTVSEPLAMVKVTPPAQPVAAPVSGAPIVNPTRELQVAVGLEGLSDKSVAQLSRELDGLDGLPSADPEILGVAPSAGNEGGI